MRPFAYERPEDTEAAIALLERSPDAALLGGGTNLVDLMRLGVAQPGVLVDISRLSGRIVERDDGGLRIGAGVRNSVLASDGRVRDRYPVLSSALLHGASGQLRNLATTGGNLLQRTRCHYFQDVSKPCNKRVPGSGCPAFDGEHRNLAILGWSETCVATHPSDMAVACVALDAIVQVVGSGGARSIAVADLHRLAGEHPERDTVLERELITAVDLPPPSLAARSTYVKVRERASYAFAVVSLAASIELEGDVVRDVRLVLGGVAHKPWRALRAEHVIRGAEATRGRFEQAAAAELELARPLRDNAYKVRLAHSLIVETLLGLRDAP